MAYWLDVFTFKSWEEFKKAGALVSGFPDRRWKTVQGISKGDILVCYLRGKSQWIGALEVTSDEAFRDASRIWEDAIYPYRLRVKPLIMLEPEAAVPIWESFTKLKVFANLRNPKRWGMAFRTSPRRLPEEDGEFIVNKLRQAAGGEPPKKEFSHSQLVDILHDVGNTLGFFVRTEEYTPDKAYRCDVTWRDYEGHSPLKVFEVELSRNIDHALSSLAHTLDVWRPEQLYLILIDEVDFSRVQKLTEVRLRGAFSRLSRKLNAYPWSEVKKLHDNLRVSKKLLTQLAER